MKTIECWLDGDPVSRKIVGVHKIPWTVRDKGGELLERGFIERPAPALMLGESVAFAVVGPPCIFRNASA